MAENARKEGATLKGGSKGKRRSRRAAKPSVKQEAADPPVEPVRKRKKMASKAKEETAIRPTSGAPEGTSFAYCHPLLFFCFNIRRREARAFNAATLACLYS